MARFSVADRMAKMQQTFSDDTPLGEQTAKRAAPRAVGALKCVQHTEQDMPCNKCMCEESDVTGPLWKTKDGRVLRIVGMTDKHINNTIRMLDRQGMVFEPQLTKALFYLAAPWPTSEHAYDAVSTECDRAFAALGACGIDFVAQLKMMSWVKDYKALVKERESRKLKGVWACADPEHDQFDPTAASALEPSAWDWDPHQYETPAGNS